MSNALQVDERDLASESSLGSHSITRIATHPKVRESHLKRRGSVYVRQSTMTQIRDHQESTARQYAMKDRVVNLGWMANDVLVVDDDLGVSGSGNATRTGFRRLLKLITDGEIGIVAGLEMSRLARNSKDWSDLFEVCAIFDTLIADEDGVFDPQDPNDRLVLGLKGIISELELHTMKVRMERGKLNKAQRGEMFLDVPVGYVLDEHGLPQFDPDDSAKRVMAQFFSLFERMGTVYSVWHYMFEHDIKLPFRARKNKLHTIDWRHPNVNTLQEIIKHPLYAGAYAYGRRKKYGKNTANTGDNKLLPPEQWKVLIKDRHPAYITWEQYLRNQERLKQNYQKAGFSGPARNGAALLGGLVKCGKCGGHMSLVYPQNANAYYSCNSHTRKLGSPSCCASIRTCILDDLVTGKVLEVLSPAGVELSLRVIEDERQRRQELEQLYVDKVSKAQYAVDLSQRRYQHVDPANRLVAAKLEKEWESALSEMKTAKDSLAELRSRQSTVIDAEERQQLTASASSIVQLWNTRATNKDKKELCRLLLECVEMRVQGQSEYVDVKLLWQGGFESCHQIVRTIGTIKQWDRYDELMDRILKMLLEGMLPRQIAATLNEEGMLSPQRRAPITSTMIRSMVLKHPKCQEQLYAPELREHEWRAEDLAKELKMRLERLQQWAVNDLVKVIQRPHSRVWVMWADPAELERLRVLASERGHKVES
ncbi:MAG: recombinase family protein [Planctomycetota bacterium]|nr:recombinase family protein [Planctomycetota bacterium]